MEHATTSDHTTAEPLFLPRGTVRAIIALALTALVITSFVLPEKITLPEEVLMIWIGAVGYYLGFRTDNPRKKKDKGKTTQQRKEKKKYSTYNHNTPEEREGIVSLCLWSRGSR
jgi:hypothetical protein